MNSERLKEGLDELGLSLPQEAVARLLAYGALLLKWNKTYNLTALRDPERVLSHHLLDSLAIVPHLPPGALLDVGSGGGLPGIPVAIAQPERSVTLLDSNNKKVAFQRQAIIELGLKNAEATATRIEDLRPAAPYPLIVSRAFAELADFVSLAGPRLAPGGRLLAMKGVYPEDEVARLPSDYVVADSVRLVVPGLDAERHLLFIAPRNALS